MENVYFAKPDQKLEFGQIILEQSHIKTMLKNKQKLSD